MKLYIRNKTGIWITFLNSTDDFKAFQDAFIPGRHFVIGDIATFNTTMRNMLLKFIEDHSEDIDCYSSTDLADPILLSRFVQVFKEPLAPIAGYYPDEWDQAKHDYINAEQLLFGTSNQTKLFLPVVPKFIEKLLLL